MPRNRNENKLDDALALCKLLEPAQREKNGESKSCLGEIHDPMNDLQNLRVRWEIRRDSSNLSSGRHD